MPLDLSVLGAAFAARFRSAVPAATLASAPPLASPRISAGSAAPTPRRVAKVDRSKETEADLVRRYQAGDSGAGAALLKMHESLILKWARHYSNKGVDIDDLEQEAKIGFLEGVKRFELDRGLKLCTYALAWVRHDAHRYLENNARTIRVPSHAQGSQANEAARTRASMVKTMWIDAPVGQDSDGDRTLGDVVADIAPDPEARVSDADAATVRASVIASAMVRARLTPQERDAIATRILADDPLTLEEVGARWGRTRERARQVQEKALIKLRRVLGHADVEGLL